MEYVLELKKIRKTFGELVANDDIDLKVVKGSVHALVGENGAGKSTVMNIVTAIHSPDSGEIILNGEKVVFNNTLDAFKHGIGMVHQEFMLFSDLTVLENVIMGFEQKNGPFIDKKKSREKVEEICRKYHFDLPLDMKVTYLPVAVLQQVEIVKVLYRGADIIILDEPTSVLTPQGIEGLFDAIRFLKGMGKTIIIITHKLKEVFEIADYITVLKDGKVVGNVLPSEVNEEKLAKMMVGREVILKAQKNEFNPGEVVLDVQNLSVVDANGVKRVKNVSFQIREGEILGIAGVAGSGQQQLLDAIVGTGGFEEGGKISYLGEDISKRSVRERRCSGISFVPQDRMAEGVNRYGNIWENSIMGYHIVHGFGNSVFLNRPKIEEHTKNVLDNYSVKAQYQNDVITSLSGGNIQKLVVGREFSMGSKLLVIEDPTRGIDVGAIEFIWARIIEMASSGIAVLLISHELNEVMQLSDTIKVMFNGELSDGGSYGEKTEDEIGLLMTGGQNNVG